MIIWSFNDTPVGAVIPVTEDPEDVNSPKCMGRVMRLATFEEWLAENPGGPTDIDEAPTVKFYEVACD